MNFDRSEQNTEHMENGRQHSARGKIQPENKNKTTSTRIKRNSNNHKNALILELNIPVIIHVKIAWV